MTPANASSLLMPLSEFCSASNTLAHEYGPLTSSTSPALPLDNPDALHTSSISSLPLHYRGKVRDIYTIDDHHWLMIATGPRISIRCHHA